MSVEAMGSEDIRWLLLITAATEILHRFWPSLSTRFVTFSGRR
jgi:hypothetical protein